MTSQSWESFVDELWRQGRIVPDDDDRPCSSYFTLDVAFETGVPRQVLKVSSSPYGIQEIVRLARKCASNETNGPHIALLRLELHPGTVWRSPSDEDEVPNRDTLQEWMSTKGHPYIPPSPFLYWTGTIAFWLLLLVALVLGIIALALIAHIDHPSGLLLRLCGDVPAAKLMTPILATLSVIIAANLLVLTKSVRPSALAKYKI